VLGSTLLLGAAAAGAWRLAAERSFYLQEMLSVYADHGGPLSFLLWLLQTRSRELGELTLNAPFARVPPLLGPLYHGVGLAALVLAAAGLRRRARRPRAVDLYLVAYLAILAVYPFEDARYFLPVLPLLFCWMLGAKCWSSQPRYIRSSLTAYGVIFLTLGAAALLFSTRLSLSGCAFPELYGDGKLRPTYQLAFGAPDLTPSVAVNSEALQVLRRYEHRSCDPPTGAST
jgi:hypothetical protein